MRTKTFLFCVLSFILSKDILAQQPTVLYSDVNTTLRVPLVDYGTFRQGRMQANQSGDRKWAFHIGSVSSPNYSSNWRPYDAGNYLSTNTYIPIGYTNGARYNGGGGQDGNFYFAQIGNYYTFNVSENTGDNVMELLETTYYPGTIATVQQYPPTSCVAPSDGVIITITTSNSPASGISILDRENVFVRYSIDGFSTSNIVQATFVSNVGTATIPAMPIGTNVSYYVYSSNEDVAGIASDVSNYGQTSHDLATLSLNNNGGSNYSYSIVQTTTWNGDVATGSWSNSAPTTSNQAIISGTYNTLTNGNINSCSILVLSSGILEIESGSYAQITNSIVNQGDIVVEDSGSLIQLNDLAINTGTILIKRETQPVRRYDYTYWSSPVANQNLKLISPLTLADKYHSWNAVSQSWQTHYDGATTMGIGKGYIVRAPQTFQTNATAIYEAPFNGIPNNGVVEILIEGGTDKWNLIGNPYPSAISADLFLGNVLNSPVIDGTLYLWTHNSPPNSAVPGDATYNYTSADYATYNLTGATGTGDNASTELNTTDNTPTGFLASGQSFFIKGLTSGNAVFNNGMRVSGNNDQFFRSANSNIAQSVIEKHRIWLNVTNTQGAFNQALVGYVQGATDSLDRGFDGEAFGGNYVSLYSIEAQKNLAIQGRALPFNESDEVDLGFKATISGAFKISLDHFDGLFASQNIYLEDKSLNIIHDLKQSPYDFTSAIGTFNNRFVLRYTAESLNNPDFETNPNTVIVTQNNNLLKIVSSLENIESINVYDILGRQIFSKNAISEKEFTIPIDTLNQQILIVKIVLQNGEAVNKKILFD